MSGSLLSVHVSLFDWTKMKVNELERQTVERAEFLAVGGSCKAVYILTYSRLKRAPLTALGSQDKTFIILQPQDPAKGDKSQRYSSKTNENHQATPQDPESHTVPPPLCVSTHFAASDWSSEA